MRIALQTLLMMLIAIKSAAESPAFIGDLGRQLSEQELVEISRAVSTNDAKPWLLVGHRRQDLSREFLDVFLSPTTNTAEIRRGQLALISRRLADSHGTWEEWRLNGRGEYAQVAIRGRDFGHVDGEQDLNRPFSVRGKLSNDELVTLVALMRSSPVWRAESGRMERIEGAWPILSIRQVADGTVVVRTRKNYSCGQEVKLKIEAKEWRIKETAYWMT
jgi:hypothetical protein